MNTLAVAGKLFQKTVTSFYYLAFCIFMPLGLYLLFGVNTEYSKTEALHGANVSAVVLVNMCVYSVMLAAASLMSTQAADDANGWVNQVALTRKGVKGYVTAALFALGAALIVPIVVLYIAGISVEAEFGGVGQVLITAVLCWLSALPMLLLGYIIGTLMRSTSAPAVASSIVVLMGFAGNAFTPLPESLITNISRFTPMYGWIGLVKYPLSETLVYSAEGMFDEHLWVFIVNVLAWLAVLTVGALLTRRHQLRRGR